MKPTSKARNSPQSSHKERDSKSSRFVPPSEKLFRVFASGKGFLTPSRLGFRENDITWNASYRAEHVDSDGARKRHPLLWGRFHLLQAMGKELGWAKYRDDAVAEPSGASSGTATENHNESGRHVVESPPLDPTKAQTKEYEASKQNSGPIPSKRSPLDVKSPSKRTKKRPVRIRKFIALEKSKSLDLAQMALQPAATDTPREQTEEDWVQSLTPTPLKPTPPISEEIFISTSEKRKARNEHHEDPKKGRKDNEQEHKVRIKGKGSDYGGETGQERWKDRWKKRVTRKMIQKEAKEKQREAWSEKNRKKAENKKYWSKQERIGEAVVR